MDSFDEKKLEKVLDDLAKKEYKGKLVNLLNERPIQFDKKTVHRTMERLNSGKEVSKKTLVKMLYQLQYMIPEYQALVSAMNSISMKAKRYADIHEKIAYPNTRKNI